MTEDRPATVSLPYGPEDPVMATWAGHVARLWSDTVGRSAAACDTCGWSNWAGDAWALVDAFKAHAEGDPRHAAVEGDPR